MKAREDKDKKNNSFYQGSPFHKMKNKILDRKLKHKEKLCTFLNQTTLLILKKKTLVPTAPWRRGMNWLWENFIEPRC